MHFIENRQAIIDKQKWTSHPYIVYMHGWEKFSVSNCQSHDMEGDRYHKLKSRQGVQSSNTKTLCIFSF